MFLRICKLAKHSDLWLWFMAGKLTLKEAESATRRRDNRTYHRERDLNKLWEKV